ncbi:AraC family transcriptional regulator [Novosphingobium sp.]|uniref:AraC family transcriptional regulator n=1 Tax=Novosphingobium sp. TaxID=1874826 RepID=UPI002FD9E3FA
MRNVISCEFLDIDHFREQLRGWDTPAIQIDPGKLSIRLNSIDLGGLIFFDVRVNRRVIDHSRIEDGWLSFVISLSPAVFCGIEVDPGRLTVLTPGREYRSVLSNNWHSIEIVVSVSVFEEEGLWLPPHFADPECATIPLPVELAGIFYCLAEAAFNGKEAVDEARLRGALLRALDKALRIGARGRDTLHPGRAVEGYRLTQQMVRYIESRFGQRIAVNDVARELNVTPRALHYAARSTFGMSPLDLILAFRLNHVRNELWDMRMSEANVTRAALMQDFGHLGRFSQQYSVLFGELPSQTLQRIRSIVA